MTCRKRGFVRNESNVGSVLAITVSMSGAEVGIEARGPGQMLDRLLV